jgi:hypothetical protein
MFLTFLPSCGWVASLQTQKAFNESCQRPTGAEVDAFLLRFALDDGRTIIMFGAPSAIQLADESRAKDIDRQAIAKLSGTRDACFRRLQSVNPDPLRLITMA